MRTRSAAESTGVSPLITICGPSIAAPRATGGMCSPCRGLGWSRPWQRPWWATVLSLPVFLVAEAPECRMHAKHHKHHSTSQHTMTAAQRSVPAHSNINDPTPHHDLTASLRTSTLTTKTSHAACSCTCWLCAVQRMPCRATLQQLRQQCASMSPCWKSMHCQTGVLTGQGLLCQPLECTVLARLRCRCCWCSGQTARE